MMFWRKRYPVYSDPGILSLALSLLILLSLAGCSPAQSPGQASPAAVSPVPVETPLPVSDEYADARQAMVQYQLLTRNISDEAVLAAMKAVPRHEFVPADYRHQAYEDHPLPIGYGQTISQPFIVALMSELADVQPGERVLEIGTGSGYQAAILAELTDQVYSIEIIPALAERAAETFDRLGYNQIVTRQADGYYGWEEYAPFDAILVTAAPDHVPQPLVNQLADGGRMIIPVGPPGGYQSLWVLERKGDEVVRYSWGGVQFVPFTRAEE